MDQVLIQISIWNSQADRWYIHADNTKIFAKKDNLLTPLSRNSSKEFIIMQDDGRSLLMIKINKNTIGLQSLFLYI